MSSRITCNWFRTEFRPKRKYLFRSWIYSYRSDSIIPHSPQGKQHSVIRWIHRTRFKVRPNTPINPAATPVMLPDGTRQTQSIDPAWTGVVVIEAEGTNEGLADLQYRIGNILTLFPAKKVTGGSELQQSAPTRSPPPGRTPFRLLRGQSRPGEVWLRCVMPKERL